MAAPRKPKARRTQGRPAKKAPVRMRRATTVQERAKTRNAREASRRRRGAQLERAVMGGLKANAQRRRSTTPRPSSRTGGAASPATTPIYPGSTIFAVGEAIQRATNRRR